MPEGGAPHDAPAAIRRGGALLAHRDFRLLWGGSSVSELGSQVTQLALPLVAIRSLRASTFDVGALEAAGSAAFLLVGLPAGAWIDRMRRRPVLIVADVGRVVALGSVPLAAALGALGLAQLYAVALVAGVLTVFFDVAYQSLLPALVGSDGLVEANAKIAGTVEIAQVAGPSLAGVLVQALGGPYAMALDACSFGASAAAVTALEYRESAPGRAATRAAGALRHEVAEGLVFVLHHRMLRAIAGCTSTSNFFNAMRAAVLVVFLVRTLHTAPSLVGLVFAAGSVGGVVAALIASRLSIGLGSARATILGSLLSVGMLVVPLAGRGAGLVIVSVAYFSYAFGGVLYNVNQVSFRQRVCPKELLGRMNATMRFLVWGTLPIGALAGGALASAVGLRPTLWISGIGGILATFWLLASPMRTMRDLEDAP